LQLVTSTSNIHINQDRTEAISSISKMSTATGDYPQDLLDSYSGSGSAASQTGLPFGNTPALLAIDVRDASLTPGSPLYAPERFDTALQNVERLIQTCREK